MIFKMFRVFVLGDFRVLYAKNEEGEFEELLNGLLFRENS